MKRLLTVPEKELKDIYIADSFFKRLAGYMFRKVPHHSAILFKPCNCIHTFFMSFDIDVLFISQDMRIVKKLEGLKPRKIIPPIKLVHIVIEAKAGDLADFHEGDIIKII